MSTRGLCVLCSGNYAVTQDGTPYKHTLGGEGTCPGVESQALVGDYVWGVYGQMTEQMETETFPTSTSGPVLASEVPDVVLWADGLTLPLLETFGAHPTFEQVQALLPERFQARSAPPEA